MKFFNHFEVITAHPVIGPAFVETLGRLLDGREDPKRAGQPKEVLEALALSTFMACFLHDGKQVFVVGPVMQQLLAMTSCKGVPREALKFPHSSFYVGLPGCELTIFDNPSGKYPRVLGAYVVENRKEVGRFNICLICEQVSEYVGDDAWVHFPVDLGTDGDFAESAAKNVLNFSKNETTAATSAHLVRVLVNLLMYLSSEDVDVRKEARNSAPRAERRRLERDGLSPVKETAYTVTYIGPKLEKLGLPKVEEMANGIKLRRHWVRGHYHRYHVGVGRETVIVKWVKPFLRGDDAVGVVTGHVAIVR